MTHDPVRNLLDRQLILWKKDPHLVAAQLYLLGTSRSLDLQILSIGDIPLLEDDELASLLERSVGEPELEPGFEFEASDRTSLIYPLRQDSELQGLWVLFPGPEEVDRLDWTREASRFSNELSALRQLGLDSPLTFGELVEAIPSNDDSQHKEGPPTPHWESSLARVEVEIEDELSACLLVDHLPIF